MSGSKYLRHVLSNDLLDSASRHQEVLARTTRELDWLWTEFENCRQAVARYHEQFPPSGTGARVHEVVAGIVERVLVFEERIQGRDDYEGRLDALMGEAFTVDHPALKDYAMLKFELKSLRRQLVRLALCPDHRGKHDVSECSECRAEQRVREEVRPQLKNREDLLAACVKFVVDWHRTQQSEKLDTAVRMATKAIEEAGLGDLLQSEKGR